MAARKTATVAFRCTEADHELLRQAADAEEITVSGMLARLLKESRGTLREIAAHS
jgi:hypothetical protein